MSQPRPEAAPKAASETSPQSRPGGLEAPPHPALDPNKKTEATHDPTADDPGNGAD